MPDRPHAVAAGTRAAAADGREDLARVAAGLDYRQLVESVGDGIYVLDLQGRFTYVNAAFLSMLGYGADDDAAIVGRPFTELLTPESARVAMAHFEQGLAGNDSGLTPFFEVDGIRADGSIVHVEVRAGDLLDHGIRAGRHGVARDITELKALHIEIEQKSQRLALLEQRARLAHELYERIGRLTLQQEPGAPVDDALEEMRRSLMVAAGIDAGLAPGDLEIVELVATGASNRQIAEKVHLSPDTIKDRLGRIMQRLGCRSRTELAAEATRRGLI